MKAIAYFFVLFSLMACKKDEATPDGQGDVLIRIWNGSSWDLDEVFVDTGDGQNDFGDLESNGMSAYKRFDSAYRYAFVSFKINGKGYLIQPVDYLGEEKLVKGKYTYKIAVTGLDSEYALLEFIED